MGKINVDKKADKLKDMRKICLTEKKEQGEVNNQIQLSKPSEINCISYLIKKITLFLFIWGNKRLSKMQRKRALLIIIKKRVVQSTAHIYITSNRTPIKKTH